MSALLFGSISSIADTSEIQRAAFNEAFAEHGLDWNWDREGYRSRLDHAGGAERIAQEARRRGEDVDAAAVHATKSRIFREKLRSGGAAPRDGVLDTLGAAKNNGWKVGFVTTTSRDNVLAVIDALGPAVGPDDFDVVVATDSVDAVKPDPAAYTFALQALGEEAGSAVAIEDNPDGVRAAAAAGVTCLAFPNENTVAVDFPGAARRVDRLAPEDVTAA
ncbi:HAD superfamily hydrolase (TIGR01509 family) [Actinomycetospora succinea]|uniref:HAD superfamily hydrolase (TIGR01509 family) n=1 Tax=Actinomycetospora succinea TaxID=663603 RepID=A0A4V3DAK0_9PSEU|nr:HAD-IA family hydrolase [Actinomycetospora succinea]TDQ62543.1 HAD superfamily hydrolase (TIGR01509 family) [Actinomycetospora succinea]